MNVQWSDLFAALAIVLTIEGILPFVNPTGAQRAFSQLARLSARELRIAGLVSMTVGLIALYFARS
jgi:uncharacterized protein YjeT (DUF2065 family)